MKCAGQQTDENHFMTWRKICVLTFIPKKIVSRPFLCGFCIVQANEGKLNSAVENTTPVLEHDSLERYRCIKKSCVSLVWIKSQVRLS